MSEYTMFKCPMCGVEFAANVKHSCKWIVSLMTEIAREEARREAMDVLGENAEAMWKIAREVANQTSEDAFNPLGTETLPIQFRGAVCSLFNSMWPTDKNIREIAREIAREVADERIAKAFPDLELRIVGVDQFDNPKEETVTMPGPVAYLSVKERARDDALEEAADCVERTSLLSSKIRCMEDATVYAKEIRSLKQSGAEKEPQAGTINPRQTSCGTRWDAPEHAYGSLNRISDFVNCTDTAAAKLAKIRAVLEESGRHPQPHKEPQASGSSPAPSASMDGYGSPFGNRMQDEAWSQKNRADVLQETNDNLRAALSALGVPVTHEVEEEARKVAAGIAALRKELDEVRVCFGSAVTKNVLAWHVENERDALRTKLAAAEKERDDLAFRLERACAVAGEAVDHPARGPENDEALDRCESLSVQWDAEVERVNKDRDDLRARLSEAERALDEIADCMRSHSWPSLCMQEAADAIRRTGRLGGDGGKEKKA
jgi:hypothetical protein